jgi:UDP-glucose 4-epimerase
MKVLVTGGAGYIGSVTATALEQAGHTPIVLDSLISGPEAYVQDRNFYRGDKPHTLTGNRLHCCTRLLYLPSDR